MKDEFGGEIITMAQPGQSPTVDEFGSPIIQAAPQGSGGPMQGLKDLLGFAGRQVDRLGPAEIRGAAEGIQNYEPEGSGSFHPGVLAAAAKGAWNGLINPEAVQDSRTQWARSGLSDKAPDNTTQSTPGFVMKAHARAGEYGLKPQDEAKFENGKMYPLSVGYASPAQVAGTIQDAISPTPLAGAAFKLGGKTLNLTADAAKMGATKAILSHYSPPRLAAYAQKIGTFGNEADAIKAVSEKLKQDDLLYTPGKANFNLRKAKNDIGSQVGQTIQEAKAKDINVNPQAVIDKYSALKDAALAESGKGVGTYKDFARDVLPEIQGMIDDLKPNELGQVSIDKGVAFRQALQDMVKKWDGTTNAPLIQQVAKDLQGSMNQEIMKSDKVLGPKLAGLNQKFSDLSNAETLIDPAYKKAIGNTVAGKSGSFLQNVAGIIKHPIDAAGDPMQALMKLNPRKAEAIANAGNKVSGIQIPQVDFPGVSQAELDALRSPPASGGLPPRQTTGRPMLNKPPSYTEGVPVPASPFGRPALPKPADPMAGLFGTPSEPGPGVPGVEGMMHPHDIAAKAAAAQADREAMIRQPREAFTQQQARPVSLSEKPESGGVVILGNSEVQLPPRRPRGNVQSNFPPKYTESPQVAAVLDNLKRMELPPQAVARIEEALKTSTGAERGKLIYDLQKAYRDWKGR